MFGGVQCLLRCQHETRPVLWRFDHLGFNPADQTRFAFEVRWPGVVQTTLGADYRVIEEGLSGRTVATESWVLPNRDGRGMLVPLVERHGTNDRASWMIETDDLDPG